MIPIKLFYFKTEDNIRAESISYESMNLHVKTAIVTGEKEWCFFIKSELILKEVFRDLILDRTTINMKMISVDGTVYIGKGQLEELETGDTGSKVKITGYGELKASNRS